MDKPRSENAPDLNSGKPLSFPKNFQAKYQDTTGQSHCIKVQNLSRGGICIENSDCLPLGTTLRFFLKIKGRTIKAQGEVDWTTREGSSFLHGIKFTFMEQEGREWFHAFIMDWVAGQVAENLDFSGLQTSPVSDAVERRSFARLKIPLRVEFGFNRETMLIHTQIYDLSEGGLCLISNFQLKKEQELSLKLWLGDSHFISLAGIVKYCVKKVHEKRTVCFNGVEFNKLADSAAKEVAQFLNQKRSELAAIEISLDDLLTKADPLELP